jgi:hypothetical protein
MPHNIVVWYSFAFFLMGDFMNYRNLFASLLMICYVGIAGAAGIGDSATFTINNTKITGQVTAVAADGTLTVTSGNAVFTLAPQGEILVTTSGAGAATTTAAYTASMNAAALNMVGLSGAGAVGLATAGITATTAGIIAVTVATIAAISNDGSGTTGTTGTQ